MSSENETKDIRVMMILEVLGKPPEHLTSTLNDLIEQIGNEKGVSVENKKINEPVEMKEQKGFYTNFAEIELVVEEIFDLSGLLFKYMPAHIEILSPELIALTNNGWGDILSEITRRLHQYDEVARVIQIEKAILEKKLRELAPPKKEESKEVAPADVPSEENKNKE
jgi:hypothetical protein